MSLSDLRRIQERPVDMLFIAILVLSCLLAIGGVGAGLERREALSLTGGPRKVDVVKIRKQISDGDLSSHKALFYKKVPE